jgi:thioesterase domain-containing protein/acyl carrier protein
VRWRLDGALEFLGRLDDQVKLRGFRIELGEIESALTGCPEVAQAVVLVREDPPCNTQLVAYVVPRQADTKPTVTVIREFLRAKLPEYMVPTAFVMLKALPLTPNGKVDRKALPVPKLDRLEPADDYLAPRTPLEELLKDVWCEVLRVDEVGMRDNFFERGGHSLMAVRLISTIETRIGVRLPLSALFQAPTFAALASMLARSHDQRHGAPIVAIRPEGSRPPLILLHSVDGNLHWSQLVQHIGPDRPIYGIQQPDDGQQLEHFDRIEQMAERYVDELRRLRPHGPYHLFGHSFGGMLAYEMAQQLTAQGEQVGTLTIVDTGPLSGRDPSVLDHLRATPSILLNIAYWFLDDLPLIDAPELYARLRRRLKRVLKWGRRAFGTRNRTAGQLDLEEYFDVDALSTSRLAACEANLPLFSRYVPQPYPGRLLLFRARRRSILGPFQYDLGWGRLVRGGLEIKQMRGTHTSLLTEPYVPVLAHILTETMDRAAR